MQIKLISLLLCALIFSHPAMANDVITNYIPTAQKVGEGRLSKFFWEVYDATLYAPNGKWSYDKPFALSLLYFLDIDGKDIADRSIIEMRQQGLQDEVMMAQWDAQMKTIFPNVQDGSVLTAIFVPGQGTYFFENGKPIGTIEGNDFIRWFSGIWLKESTSEPELREKLLGN